LKTKILSSIKNAIAYYNAGVVAVNSKIVRLAPDVSRAKDSLISAGKNLIV
jgi:hypothetical protein